MLFFKYFPCCKPTGAGFVIGIVLGAISLVELVVTAYILATGGANSDAAPNTSTTTTTTEAFPPSESSENTPTQVSAIDEDCYAFHMTFCTSQNVIIAILVLSAVSLMANVDLVVGLRLQKRGFFTLWLLFYGLVWVGLFVAAGFLFAVDKESSNIRRPLLKALFCFSLAG